MKSKTTVVEEKNPIEYMNEGHPLYFAPKEIADNRPTHVKNINDCPHQFFKIADETKKEGEQILVTVRWGVKVMCALCGQRRILWTDGEVEVL